MRIRVHGRGGDQPFFSAVSKRLADMPGLVEVRTSARTGSVLVLFEDDVAPFVDALTDLLQVVPNGPDRSMGRIRAALDELEAQVSAQSEGRTTLPGVLFYALLGASAYQAVQGRFLPAGMTLLKYALETMSAEAARELASARGRDAAGSRSSR